jgi:hypothetical protein
MSSAARRLFVVLVVFAAAGSARAQFTPWDPLVVDSADHYESWIYYGAGDPKLTLHTVNAGDYDLGFDQRRNNGGARGMNALKFSWGGATTGHLVSASLSGSFGVTNTGDNREFTELVLMLAIDASSLPPGFGLSLGVQGESLYDFDPAADFAFYDPAALGYATGRPTGYYPGTPPEGEWPDGTSPEASPIAYSFDAGMVSLWAASGVGIGPSETVAFDYAFTDLPGTAVFSVYGYDGDVGWIYHTNRGLTDNNDPGRAISTFEVTPEPATLGLLLGGLLLAARSRRKG